MTPQQEWNIVHAKLVTLLAINVLQPVELKYLRKKLKPHVRLRQLDIILKELIAQNKVAVEKQHYRLTYNAFTKSIVLNRGKFLRDNQRMEHLIQLTKQRGGS